MALPGGPLPFRAAGWFIFVSYFLGGPVFAAVEYSTQILSDRFGFTPDFFYVVGLTQFACSIALFSHKIAALSLVLLTVISVGAIASHFKIGSPVTALPALGYTVLQLWYLYRIRRYRPGGGNQPEVN